jgi:hypothetical protein
MDEKTFNTAEAAVANTLLPIGNPPHPLTSIILQINYRQDMVYAPYIVANTDCHLARFAALYRTAFCGHAPTCRLQIVSEKGELSGRSMDQVSIKIPNPKCRLFWCLLCADP